VNQPPAQTRALNQSLLTRSPSVTDHFVSSSEDASLETQLSTPLTPPWDRHRPPHRVPHNVSPRGQNVRLGPHRETRSNLGAALSLVSILFPTLGHGSNLRFGGIDNWSLPIHVYPRCWRWEQVQAPSTSDAALPRWSNTDPDLACAHFFLWLGVATCFLVVFLALLCKKILRHNAQAGTHGSILDRARDRQCWMDGMETWRFDLVVRCLSFMPGVGSIFLSYGLYVYASFTNKATAREVIDPRIVFILPLSAFVLAVLSNLSHIPRSNT
jgi:hypothetical protein